MSPGTQLRLHIQVSLLSNLNGEQSRTFSLNDHAQSSTLVRMHLRVTILNQTLQRCRPSNLLIPQMLKSCSRLGLSVANNLQIAHLYGVEYQFNRISSLMSRNTFHNERPAELR